MLPKIKHIDSNLHEFGKKIILFLCRTHVSELKFILNRLKTKYTLLQIQSDMPSIDKQMNLICLDFSIECTIHKKSSLFNG